MKRILALLLLSALAVAAVTPKPAPFGTVVVPAIAYADHDGTTSQSIVIPKFNTMGGTRTLLSVSIEITGDWSRIYSVENLHTAAMLAVKTDEAPGGGSVQVQTSLLLIPVAGGGNNVDAQNQVTFGPHTLANMDVYDGITDFGGRSGTTENVSAGMDETTPDVITNAAVLTAMSSAVKANITCTLAGNGSWISPTCSNCISGAASSVDDGEILVTYTF